MAWSTSQRRDELPADWQLRRIRVLRRDGYRCQAQDSLGARCYRPANQVDHIKPHSAGGTDDLDNLQALCRWHHAQKSSAEGHAAQRPRPTQRNPDRESHPGLLP
jgi:5-methylcytosine-specific restriction endonuclease McrA